MKSALPPRTPEGSPWQRRDSAFGKVLTVSKEELLEAEAKEKQEKKAKKRAKKP
jgi:hypothetical protein